MLRSVIGFLLALVPAVAVAYALASVLATQVILARIEGMGLPITLRDRLQATGHDLLGLLPTYAPLLLVAFLLAMPVAAWLSRRLRNQGSPLFVLAGFAAVLVLHLLLKQVLGLNGVAAVRDLHGLLSQAVAGAFGGYLFFVLTGRVHRKWPRAAH